MLILFATLRAANFLLTPSVVDTYDPLCKMSRVDAVLLRRTACVKDMKHVIADIRLKNGNHVRCHGYGKTQYRADNDAAVKGIVKLLILQELSEEW